MKKLSYLLHRRKIAVCFLLTFLITMGILLLAFSYMEHSRFQNVQNQASNTAELMTGRIAHAIDNQLSLTYTLKALLEKSGGDAYAFENLLPEIVGDLNAESVSLAPDGIVKIIYPLVGNEEALNHNLLTDPARSVEAELARDSRKLTLSGPYELRQGGFGLIGRLPVYFTAEDGHEYFWGFTCVTIALPGGLADARIDNLAVQGYSYELWRTAPDTGEKQIIMESKLPLSASPIDKNVSLPNSTWTLSIAPVNGWINQNAIVIELLAILLFALLCSFLSYAILNLADRKKELSQSLEQQSSNYRQLNQLNEDLRIFRHDMNNHMLSLSSLLAQKEWDAAQDYISYLSDGLAPSARLVNTENYVLDALLSAKIKEARLNGIHVEEMISIGKKLEVENGDISILFGNALDNAVEACLRSAFPTPELFIRISYHGGILQTVITNSIRTGEQPDGSEYQTSKTDKVNHGFGMKQIQSIAKKYKGTVAVSATDSLFTISFSLFQV